MQFGRCRIAAGLLNLQSQILKPRIHGLQQRLNFHSTGVLLGLLDVPAHEAHQAQSQFFVGLELVLSQEVLHILDHILGEPALVLATGLPQIVLELGVVGKRFVLLGFRQQLPHSLQVAFELEVDAFVFLGVAH